MKLYTELQVRKAIELARDTHQEGLPYLETDEYDYSVEEVIKQLTPIELPSDEEISTSLCYYDLRNADGISQFKEDKEHYGLNDDDFKDLGNFAKKDCGCDNCFYGKHKLANYILKIQGDNK